MATEDEPQPREGRALFIDDGGDTSEFAMLCALCLDSVVVEQALEQLATVRTSADAFIPAFRREPEFHGIRLSARVKKGERTRALAESLPLLRDHERAYLYQHALHATAALPGHPQIYTAGIKVTAGRRPKDAEKGKVVRTLMGHFMDWVLEEEGEIAATTMDRGDQSKHNVRGYDEVGNTRGGLLSQMEVMDSRENLLLQMADLACYAAYRRVKSTDDDPKRHPGLQRWYQEILGDLWPAGSAEHGVRNLGHI